MPTLVNQISSFLNKRVVDKTGLTGLYDFELQFSMGSADAAHDAGAGSRWRTTAAPIDDGPTMFDAVRELGIEAGVRARACRAPRDRQRGAADGGLGRVGRGERHSDPAPTKPVYLQTKFAASSVLPDPL